MKKLIYPISLLSLLFIAQCGQEDDPKPKEIETTFSYTLGSADYRMVSFTSTAEGATEFEWNFGDESALSIEQNPTHTYAKPGQYSVTLKVKAGIDTGSFTQNIAVLPTESASKFEEIGSLTLDGAAAAEISAFDAAGKRLFVVNNFAASKIDVIDISNPSSPEKKSSLDISAYGAGVNSVAVNGTYLAAAVEATDKTANGKAVIFKLSDLTVAAHVTVGALPDMITFTPDGAYILTANEGEPNDDFVTDPEGSVSIIKVSDFSVATATFTSFNGQMAQLKANGVRISGPTDRTVAQDLEPEYVAVSADSKTAFVTLQENNALAIVDIATATVSSLKGLGSKDHSLAANKMDPSDRDDKVEQRNAPVNGLYMPDAISYFTVGGLGYLVTANEGDAREWGDYLDETRIKDADLDPTVFTNAADLQKDASIGRLKLINTEGDTDGDGDYDKIFTYGARSFSIWSTTGELVYDSGDDLEAEVIAAGIYDDGRSDDKGVEPEGTATGEVAGKNIIFIGLERVDAVAIYEVSTAANPSFIGLLETGDAPEGVLFISKENSPNGRSLLVVSSEGDGVIKIYQAN